MGRRWTFRAAAMSLVLSALAFACALSGVLPVRGQQEGSDPVADTPPPVATAPPARPTGLSSSASHDSVSLTWDDPADATITHHQVFRRDTSIHAIGEFITLEENTGSADTTYTDESVEPENKYVYRVKAVNAPGASPWSSFSSATTLPAPDPPAAAEDLAPSGLIATLVEGGGVTLTWSAPAEDSGSVSGYEILRAVGEGALTNLVADTGNTDTTYSDATATEAGETYAYQVKAIRGEERSQASGQATVQLAHDAVDLAPTVAPARPTGLSSEASHDSVSLTWDDPGDATITHYQVFRRDTSIHAIGEFITLVDNTGSAATTYTDETVEPESQYVYRVKAVNAQGASQWSSFADAQTPAAPDPPPAAVDLAPSGLTATLVEGGGVTLTWTAPAEDSGSVSGYEILRAVGEGALTNLVADTGNTDTTYSDATATEAGETYAYQVKAIRGEERSQASGQAQVQLPHDPVDLAPTGLTATLADGGGATLTWTAPAEDADSVTGYEILRAVGGGAFTTLVSDSGNTATAYSDATATEAGETYAYQVKAIRGEDRSQASGQAQVQLPHDAVDLAPTGLVATLVEGGGYTLSWTAPAEEADSVTGYEILRAVGEGELTTLVADTANTDTTYTDATASQVGTSYAYGVVALRDGVKSQQSNEASADLPVRRGLTQTCPTTDPDCSGPGPADLAVTEMAAGLQLSWNPPSAPTLTNAETTVLQYQIMRSPGNDTYSLVTCVDAAARSYLDWSAAAGGQYRYQVRAIYFANDACTALRDIDVDLTVGGTEYEPVDGLWSDGTTLWASDEGNDRLLAFRLSDGLYDSGRDIVAEAQSSPVGLWGREGTLWALTESGGSGTPITLDGFSLADDATFGDRTARVTLGHKADNSGAPLSGYGLWADADTFWMSTVGNSTLFAYDWAASGTLTRNTTKQVSAGSSSANLAASMWGDGTTMWIATSLSASNDTVAAINWPAGTTDTSKDIGLRSSHGSVGGMWSDGEIIWIASGEDDLFAYPLSKQRQHSAWSRSNRAAVVAVTPATAVVAGAGTLKPSVQATDPENDDLTYAWTSDNGGTFSDAAVAGAKWTAPAATANDQTITLTLTVTDAHRETATATVVVTVPASTSGSPSVSATAAPAIVDGGDTVTLEGTAADPDGDGLSYAWTSSGGGTFAKAAALVTTWTAPAATTITQRITLTLTATDDSSDANRSLSTVVVIVRAELRNPFLRQTVTNATGRPVVLVSAEGGGILAADPSRIADADGLPYIGSPESGIENYVFSYQWIRVDGVTEAETEVGTDSQRYQLVDADFGKLIKVQVSFTDRGSNPEVVTSVPFGPLVRPAALPSPSTLVGNTGQSPSATATITGTYAMGFKLGKHGQGYEISSVSIDLPPAPSRLSVSLWTGGPPGSTYSGSRSAKLFDFENPPSFKVGLNEFTAPAGAFAYQNVNYWIVLSDFGDSLSITETTSDAEDAGGETGATLSDTARSGTSSVLRLAIKGSQRTSGILAANFAQPSEGDQEIMSLGDNLGWTIDVGAADRYLVRGVTFARDDSTSNNGGFINPYYLRSDSLSGARHFNLVITRNVNGLPVWTAPQGATVVGSKIYVFDWADINVLKAGGVDRIGGVLARGFAVSEAADGQSDEPTAPGVTLGVGEIAGSDYAGPTPLMAVHGEALGAMVQNLGQTDNSYVSVGGANKVLSQGFTTGPDVDGYELLGIGVNIEGSSSSVPDDSASVSVAVHAESSGQPGAKLFDLLSPTEYGAGHSFFEAPAGTTLDPSTSYVLVWTYNAGTSHRLRRTASDGEDSGGYAGFSIADTYYLGADLDNLAAPARTNSLEIAVYRRVEEVTNASGRPAVYPSAEGAGILFADPSDIEDPDGVLVYSSQDEAFVRRYDWSYQWIRVDGETAAETDVGVDSSRYQPVEADIGHLIKVRVSFRDQAGFAEAVTSLPFGPIAEAGPSRTPSLLVGNTEQADVLTGFDLDSDNGNPRGIWGDDDTIWVVDDGSGQNNKLFAYKSSDGSRDSDKDFNLNTSNTDPIGMCSDGTTLFVVDVGDDKIYAYTIATWTRDADKDINLFGNGSQDAWCDGATIWVTNDSFLHVQDRIEAYNLSNGNRDTSKEFTTLNAAGNRMPSGIWSDGTTMWVADVDDDKIYAYKMSDKSRDSGKDITLDSGNDAANGMWSDGYVLLVVDTADTELYAYDLPGAPPASPRAQETSRTANITQQYAMGFRLGNHGQGYEISSVSIELAAVPASLTVSLWVGTRKGTVYNGVAAYKLFDFTNPPSYEVGLNEFTAPAGAFAYQNVDHFIVLSGFGSSLSINETTSNAEDAGGETGAILFNNARVRALGSTGRWGSSNSRSSVLRLAIEGSRRDRGILASNYAQPEDEALQQEIISKGDKGGMPITLGAADRYLIRGFSWLSDDSTPSGGGFTSR